MVVNPGLHFPSSNHTASGSVLLAVLCLVASLSFLIIMAASAAGRHADMQQSRQGSLRARQLAEMGVAVAAHPMVLSGDPLFRRKISDIEGFEVIRGTEEARLNLNLLLTEERMTVLERVFRSWGMSPAEAQSLVARLMDWTDADDLKRRPDSAEKLDYAALGMPGLPLNRKLASLDELDLMPGVEQLYKTRPDWRSFFTLRGSGQLDVNMAFADVLAAATGASLENARQLVDKRNGLDGLPQTVDDTPLAKLEEALFLLGLDGTQAAETLPLLVLHGSTLRIESTGIAGDSRCGLAVVVSNTNGRARIIEWREFVAEETSP